MTSLGPRPKKISEGNIVKLMVRAVIVWLETAKPSERLLVSGHDAKMFHVPSAEANEDSLTELTRLMGEMGLPQNYTREVPFIFKVEFSDGRVVDIAKKGKVVRAWKKAAASIVFPSKW
jgi:hypothetical protein